MRKLILFRSNWAKLVLATCGAPALLLALMLFPSPTTEMKMKFYSFIIPVGVAGCLLAILVECTHRRHERERHRHKIWWPDGWWDRK